MVSGESRIANRSLRVSQCDSSASCTAGEVWPGAQTIAISSISSKHLRPVRAPGPPSLPMYIPSRPPPTCTAAGALSSFLSPAGAAGLVSTLAPSGAPTLTTKHREPPLLKKPYTACAKCSLQSLKSPKVRTNCDQLVISTDSFSGPLDDSPRNPTVLVPTASIGLDPRSTSST